MRYLCWILILVSMAPAATYYVATTGSDTTGDGSIGTPWATIQYGINHIAGNPDDILDIRGGTYRETVAIPATLNGTSGHPIIIRGHTGETVVLRGDVVVTGWTQCVSDEAGLTCLGVTNANYASIYKATIPAASLPTTAASSLFWDFKVFEDDAQLYIARSPDQTRAYGWDMDLFTHLTTESEGLTVTMIDSDLTEADDYWNGAYLDIWSHNSTYSNNVTRRTVTDWDLAPTPTATFTPTIGSGGIKTSGSSHPDGYAFVNHPLILSKMGEFYINPTPSGGNYTIYLWPTVAGDPDGSGTVISVMSLTNGITNTSTAHNDYITIRDMTIKAYAYRGIYLRGGATRCSGLTVDTCIITDIAEQVGASRTSAVDISYCNYPTVQNCNIQRGEQCAIQCEYCDHSLIKNNTALWTTHTQIYVNSSTVTEIIGNTAGSPAGIHGNAVSIYKDCTDTLIAKNYIWDSAIAFQSQSSSYLTRNVCIYANVLNGGETVNTLIWPNGYSALGWIAYLNNTVIGAASVGIQIRGINDPTFPSNYVVNNIAEGMTNSVQSPNAGKWDFAVTGGTWDAMNVVDRSNNLFTVLYWSQSSGKGYSAAAGELVSGDLSIVFNNYVGSDFTLKVGSPAIHKGKSLQTATTGLIDVLGLEALFPDCDFATDIVGTAWASTPSMGAYETGGFAMSTESLTASVEEGSALVDSLTSASFDWDTTGETGTVTYAVSTTKNGVVVSVNPPAINSGTGVLTWTPTASPAQDGEYIVTVTATDETPTVLTRTLTVTVKTPSENHPPDLNEILDQYIIVGSTLTQECPAFDLDNDTLTWSLYNNPSWLTIVSDTGHLSGTPAYPGYYRDVEVRCNDGTVTVSQKFDIEVSTGTYYFPGFFRS